MHIFLNEPDQSRTNNPLRTIKMTWELGDTADFDGQPATAIARLHVSHDKNRKRYIASVRRIDVIKDDLVGTVEKFRPVTGTGVQLTSTPCARYSAKGLAEAADAALAELRDRIDDPKVVAVGNPESPA